MDPGSSRTSSNELISSAGRSSTNSINTASYSSKAPIDPASHHFNPPLPIIEQAYGCQRCNLVISVVYWCQINNLDCYAVEDQSYVFHRTRGDLEDGVRNRCWWCLRLQTSLANIERLRNQAQVIKEADSSRGVFLVFKLSCTDLSWFGIRITTGTSRYETTDSFESEIKFFVDSRRGFLREGLENLGSYTGGPSTWKYVENRIHNCAMNHPECQNPSPWVPTRLVEVRTMGASIQLRMVPTEKWAERKRYISLSHRWESHPTHRLTKETYDMYQDRIPMEDLPRKYIDAIQAAQHLGVQYLWIDSLCIIQDDQEDWEIESAQMHRVYQHGCCNISAASSISSKEGLFYERNVTWLRPHVIIPGNNLYPVVVSQPMDADWYAHLDREPLYRRAWVCQERLLSTRNVSFTEHLVYFECAKEMSSELTDGEDGLQESNIRTRSRILDDQLLSLRTLDKHQIPHDAWQTVVEFYSSCDLTHPADKLVAVSGVARVFHERIKTTYLAGIWSDNLLEGLAWQRSKQAGSPRPRYTQYLAPSWSWVSVNAQVEYEHFGNVIHPLAECEEVSTVPYGNDPLGRVRSGSLRIRCYPTPLLLDYDRLRKYDDYEGWPLEWEIERALKAFIPKDLKESGLNIAACTLDDCKVLQFAAAAEWYVVPLLLTQLESDIRTSFIILEPLTPTWGLYRRLGLCHLRSKIRSVSPSPSSYDDSDDSVHTGPSDHSDHKSSDVDGGMPAVCQEVLSLGLSLENCRVLANMIRASQEADVPAKERTDDGRCLITII